MFIFKHKAFVKAAATALLGLGVLSFLKKPIQNTAWLITQNQHTIVSSNSDTLVIPLAAGKNSYEVSGQYEYSFFNTAQIRIIADDCIKQLRVNGVDVDLSLHQSSLCDYNQGFLIDLSRYLSKGTNKIDAVVTNESGVGGWVFKPEQSNLPTSIAIIFIVLSLFVLIPQRFLTLKPLESRYAVFALMLLSCATLLSGYWKPQGLFWDENYHIASAQKYLNGVHFLEPHPPLGKLFVAAGELILNQDDNDSRFIDSDYARMNDGEAGFAGYRLFPVLFAIGCIFVLFLLIKQLTQKNSWAILGASWLALENSFLLHSRAAMLDSVLLFFSLLTLYFLTKDKLTKKNWTLAGLAFGAALATKYNAVFLVVLFLVQAFREKKIKGLLSATITGLVVFLSVWQIHFITAKKIEPSLAGGGYYHSSDEYHRIVDRQSFWNPISFSIRLRDSINFFFHYSKGVPALNQAKTDENGSPFWYWLTGGKSINYKSLTHSAGKTSYLYLVPNLYVYLMSLLGLIFTFAWLLAKQTGSNDYDSALGWVPLSLVCIYVFYAITMLFSPRVMYLYHYQLPLVIGVLLFFNALYFVKKMGSITLDDSKKEKSLIFISLLVVATFIYFSPLTYFWPVSNSLLFERNWLPTWDIHCNGCSSHIPFVNPHK